MGRQALQPNDLVIPKLPYSPVALGGNLVYTAGQVGFDSNGELVSLDIEGQARQTLDNVGRCMAAAGCGFEDVIKVTTFVTDWANFDAFNEIYQEYFKPPYPARTTIQVGLPEPFLVEVEAVAFRPT